MKRCALTLLSFFALALPARGAVEDFATWTEVDAGGYLTVGDNDVVAHGLPGNVTATLGKNFGVDYWANDWSVTLEFTGGTCSHQVNSNVLGVWGVSDLDPAGDPYPIWNMMFFGDAALVRWTRDADGHALLLELHNYPDHLYFHDPNVLTVSTKYYVTISFDADGGDDAAGLYTMRVCTTNYYGEAGAVLVDTQTLSVPTGWAQDFDFAATAFSRSNSSASAIQSGTIENIEVGGYTPTPPVAVPDKVTTPSPAHQATGVSIDPTLTWAAADGATNYNVYFGQGSLSLIGNQATRSYTPSTLTNATGYQWRIDANNVEGATTGDVWTFTTAYAIAEPNLGTTQDFTQWTIVDSQSEIVATDANTITATNYSSDHGAYAYRNFGAGFFSGDLTVRWRATISSVVNYGTLGMFALTNRPSDYQGWVYGGDDVQAVWCKAEGAAGLLLRLGTWSDGAVDSNSMSLTAGTSYFFHLVKDFDAGDNSAGLLTLYVSTTNYHGEDGAVDVNSLVWDVPTGKDGAYSHAVTAFNKSNHGTSAVINGTISYLDIGAEGSEPSYDPPAKATPAYPTNGATSVSRAPTLTWNAVTHATNYDVYFGTPGDLTKIGNQTARNYVPGTLEYETTYAWRIDPNNAYGLTQGDQWTFTTGAEATAGSASSVTQYGITWTFSTAHTVGQFANGDYYVVGPITLTAISPSGATQNGSMINPSSGTAQGFDSRSSAWSASTNIATSLPRTVPVGSSIVSTRSLTDASSASYVGYAAVLTVVASAPADGSFRPPYYGTDKTVRYNTSQLNYGLLYGLTPTSGAPTPAAAAAYFDGPWIDFINGWGGRTIHPAAQMPPYGRDLSAQIGSGALVLHLDYTAQQKELLMIRFTQLGIDLHGIASHPNGRTTWGPDGGHCMGRKYPILFAGSVLGSQTLLDVANKSGAYLWSAKPGGGFYGPGNPPPDYIYFQEDAQTFFIDQFMANLNLQTCVSGPSLGATSTTITIDNLPKWSGNPSHQYIEITSGPGAGQKRWISGSNYNRNLGGVTTVTVTPAWTTTPVTGSSMYLCRGYEAADIGTAEWGVRHADLPTHSNPSWGADYRVTANIAFPGWTLAARIMNLESVWNHEPLFAWMDRWMAANQPDGDFPRADRGSWVGFHADMWETYRDNLPDPITTPPVIPANPTPADAATGTALTATLRWEGFATTWTVYLGTSPDSLVYQDEVTIRQYAPTLEYGETYYWQIGATNAYGSTLSPVWSFTVADEELQPPGTPAIQSPASGATNQATSLTMRWSATGATTRYDVWFGTQGNMENIGSSTTTSFPVSGLSYETTYEWRIEAIGTGGSTSSVTATFTTIAEGQGPQEPPVSPHLPPSSPGVRVRGPLGASIRPDWGSQRYSTPFESLHVASIIQEPGLPGTYVVDPHLTGYLERVVIVANGDDTQWSLRITDAAGAVLFEANDLNMTAGPVGYDGQRIPFHGGLLVHVNETTGADRFEIYAYVWEVFTP